MRAMLIDDSAAMRAILRSVLRDLGFHTIEEASDGQDALSRAGAFGPHLILVDLDLPVLDGASFVRAFRRLHAGVPVLIVSADASREGVMEAIRAGASGYLVKPFTPGALRERVARALGARAPVGLGDAA